MSLKSRSPRTQFLDPQTGDPVEPRHNKPVVVRVKEWDEAALAALLERVGHAEVHRIPELNLLRLEPDEGTDYDHLIKTLNEDPLVVHAYVLDPTILQGRPHGNVVRTVASNDPLQLNQYHLLRHDFYGAWRYTKGSGGKIGVTDSGTTPYADADIRNADFGRTYEGVVGGNTGDRAFVWDGGAESHGTCTSSEISLERSGNGINGTAAAPDCTLYFGQIVDGSGWWDPYVAMGHHVWMANNGCKAINVSWGYVVLSTATITSTSGWPPGYTGETIAQLISDFQASMDYCWNHNCLVVIAPNDFATNLGDPADGGFHAIWGAAANMELPEQSAPHTHMPHSMCVSDISAMADMYGAVARGAWGHGVDMVAAGEAVWLMGIADVSGLSVGFVNGYGTSFSAPLVTAAVGLMDAVNHNLTAQDIWDILMASGDDFRIETTPELFLNIPGYCLSASPIPNAGLLWVPGNSAQPVIRNSAGGSNDNGGWGPDMNFNLDGSVYQGNFTTDRWTQSPSKTQAQAVSIRPGTYLFPDAKVLNAAKAVIMALSRAHPGNVYPYVQAWGPGHLWGPITSGYPQRDMDAFNSYRSKMYAFNAGAGTITTTLDGNVALEVRGFSTDPITSVELWVGSTKVYDGPGGILRCAAVSAGNPQPFTVVAHTASATTSDTLTDFVVDSLVVLDDFPLYQSWYDLKSDATYSTLPPPLNTTNTFHPTFTANAIFSPIGAVTTLFSTAFAVDAISLDRQIVLRRNSRLGASYLYGDPGGSDLWSGFHAAPGMAFVPTVVTKRAIAFGVTDTMTFTRTLKINRNVGFTSHSGFGETPGVTPGRSIAFGAHPVIAPKAKMDMRGLFALAAHAAAVFTNLRGAGATLSFPAHAGLLILEDVPNEGIALRAHAGFALGKALDRQNSVNLGTAHPRMTQRNTLAALDRITCASSLALGLSYIRERNNVYEDAVTVGMEVSQTAFGALGRLPLRARVGLVVAGVEQTGTSEVTFDVHPTASFVGKLPPEEVVGHVRTVFTLMLFSPGGVLLETVEVVAHNEAQAKQKVTRPGVGMIVVKSKRIDQYFDDPMEELELATHYAPNEGDL